MAMIFFDMKRLEKVSDKDLFHLCMTVGGDVTDFCDDIKMFESDIGDGDASFVGCWCSYDSSEIQYLKSIPGFAAAVTKLQETLRESPTKHFVSVAVSPREVSYQVFNREKGLQYLVDNHSVNEK